jgi:hypothetical protein
VITPLAVFSKVLRMPELRIPIDAVELAWQITWGVKFVTPSRPDLDGSYFKANSAKGGRQLVALVNELGIPVEVMPRRDRFVNTLRDFRTQQANAWRWMKTLGR